MAATAQEIEALYVERHEAFSRVLAGMLHDRDRARDAVQEAFARALAKSGVIGAMGRLSGGCGG